MGARGDLGALSIAELAGYYLISSRGFAGPLPPGYFALDRSLRAPYKTGVFYRNQDLEGD